MLRNLVKDGLQLSRRKRDNVYHSQGPINEWDLVDCRDLFPRWDFDLDHHIGHNQ